VKDGILSLAGIEPWAVTVRTPGRGRAVEMQAEKERVLSKEAFWDLLSPSRAKLYNYIHKSLNFSVEAEDVFQETVLNAFQYFDSFDPTRDFAPWLFAIAHNVLRDHFRRAGRESGALGAELASVEDGSYSRELVRQVYRYAEQLKPRQREVFFLFYDGGFSIAEISNITGLGEGNVRFLLNRARKALKKVLGA
jgi:RNA polymerase sigma-70 factor, ECF subfamily